MTRFFKFLNDGTCIGEAPYSTIKNGELILGYNKPTNEAMLLEDGYVKYEGSKDCFHIRLENGAVVELPDEPYPMNTVFTKLQIRRAMRKLGKEDQLDAMLSGNAEVQKDWQDAQDIDLSDEVFKQALTAFDVSDGFISEIIEAIEEQ